MNRSAILSALCLFVCAACMAADKQTNLDLTKGERPKEVKSYCMGPTGFVGWMFNNGRDSSEARQILVTSVEAGSPAEGKLKPDDVVLGADGTGAAPTPFKADARKALAAAIGAAEARNPATLKLLIWRAVGKVQPAPGSTKTHVGGQARTVTLTLETLGAYAETAPYNCEKSKKALAKGLEYLYAHGKPKLFSMNALVFLAANDPTNPNNAKYQAKAKEWVYDVIPSEEAMEAMLGDFSQVHSSKPAWTHAYHLILLAEYYLQTRDKAVLPAIEAYAVCYAKGQSWIGTTGHGYALKNPDGGFNGPMAGYGAVNGSGVAGFLGMVLARKCGIKRPEVTAAIKRADLFLSHFAFRSGIGYGEQGPSLRGQSYDANGKHGTSALAFALQPKRANEAQFFMKMTACSSYNRAASHAGPYFNYVWPALGAAAGGQKLATHYFQRTRWDHELSRMWNGRFVFAPLNRGGADVIDGNREAHQVTTLLAYALPLRQLYITGRDHDRTLWLNDDEVKETVAAEDYDPNGKTIDQLLTDLDNWSPNVRHQAVQALAAQEDNEYLPPTFKAMAKDTTRSRISRAHACTLVAKAQDKPSADLLVSLLQDEDNWVRYAAAYSLRTMPAEIKKQYVNELLRAAIAMERPTFPLDPDDPLQQALGEVSMLLFYDGRAGKHRGVVRNRIDGVDRKLLLPAIRAISKTAGGLPRTILRSVLPSLSFDEVVEIGDAIVESTRVQAPADAMFSRDIQKAGAEVLQKHGIAEGVPLLRVADHRIGGSTSDIFRKYAGAVRTVSPDPHALDWIYEKLHVKGDLKAKAAIEAVINDKQPRTLTPLKEIHSVTAKSSVLNLPATSTELIVEATNSVRRDEKDSFYTWRKVYGSGDVVFKPNGTWDSKTTSVEFTGKRPGKYRFEVTMSDVLGYTIVQKTVDVTLNGKDGKLPPNQPAEFVPLAATANPGVPLPIELNGIDPEKDELAFRVTGKPKHGKLSGVPPLVTYTADFGYAGEDAFTVEVIDGQGVGTPGTVSISVEPKAVGVSVYEGFDYLTGDFIGKASDTSIGLDGTWSGGRSDAYVVTNGSFGPTNMPTTGGKLSSRGWHVPATRALNPEALARDGLLEDGGELWLSAVMGMHENINLRNSGLAFGLLNKADPKSADVGIFWSTMSVHAVINGKRGHSGMGWPSSSYRRVFTPLKPLLFVAHCKWGAGPDKPDTVTVYIVIEDHRGQLIRLRNPVSTNSSVIDQSKLNALYIKYYDGFLLDEIRVGPTYESAILGTISTKSKTN